jgi:hypothetical protein
VTIDQSPLPEYDSTGGHLLITSGYRTPHRPTHYGVDMGTTDGIEIGVPCYPVKPGKIVAIKNDGPAPSAGINVHLLCDDGSRWKYFHLNAVNVVVNQRVGLNDIIAWVGNTGTGAAHLHLEKHDGSFSNPVNPEPEVREAIAAGRYPGTVPTPEEDMPLTPADARLIVDTLANDDTFLTNIAIKVARTIGGQSKAEGQSWAQNITNLGDVINTTLAVGLGGGSSPDAIANAKATADELAKRLSNG